MQVGELVERRADVARARQEIETGLATFGVSDAAIMDVVTGRFAPTGRLPFALANRARALTEQAPDAPGYDPEDTLFPFGHGLSY